MEPGDSMPHSQGFFNNLILSGTNPIPRIDTYFFKLHSNIVLPSTPMPSLLTFWKHSYFLSFWLRDLLILIF